MKRFFLTIICALSLYSAHGQLDKPYFYLRGRDYIVEGRYSEAIESLNLLLRSLPKEYEGYFLRGVAKYNLDDMQGALQDFTSALFHNPIYILAYQYRGITRSRLGSYDEALQDFAKAIEMRPNFAGAYYSRAVTNFLNQQFASSIADYNEYLRIEPRDPQAHVNRGTSYLYLGDTTAAIRDYNRAIQVNAYLPDAYLRRGLISLTRKETTQGIEDMNRAIKLDSTFSIAYFYRAMGHNALGKLNNSLADFDQAIRYDSTNSVSFFNRALLRTQVGDYNRAIDDYNRVAQSNPNNVLVYYNRAAVYAQLGDVKNAIADYTSAIKLYPDFANAYLQRSRFKMQMGDRKGSKQDYETGERKIREYQSKMTADSFDKYADTSKHFNEIMSFDADFGNKDFSRLQGSRDGQIVPRPMYSMVVAVPDTIVGYDPTRYANARLEKFIGATNIRGLKISNQPTNLDINYVIERDSILARGELWSEIFERAIVQSIVSQYSSAINTYNFLVSEKPNDPFALLNRAVTRCEMIEFSSSLQGDYQNATTNTDPAARLKATAKRADDFSEVVSDLKRSLALMPELPHTHFNLGNVYAKQGEWTLALDAYTKAIELFPYFADAYFNRGVVQIMVGETQKGCLDFSKAGELGIEESYTVMKKFCLKKQ